MKLRLLDSAAEEYPYTVIALDSSEYKPVDQRTPQMILLAGWGYYDVTSFPYGGSFHRADKDIPVTIVPGVGQYPDEVKVSLPGGRFGIVKSGALKVETV